MQLSRTELTCPGTGLSSAAKGAPQEIKNEIDVAKDFAGFWKNFMKTFDLKGRKVYIAGESYAGQYIPYIAQYMLEQNNTEYYNVKGIQINDPSIGDDTVLEEAPAVTHMIEYNNVFNLNQVRCSLLFPAPVLSRLRPPLTLRPPL